MYNGSTWVNSGNLVTTADWRTVSVTVYQASTAARDVRLYTSADLSGGNIQVRNHVARLAIPDRSVNNNAIGIHGTLDVDAVATGAELKALSGFSNDNYLKRPKDDIDYSAGYTFYFWTANGEAVVAIDGTSTNGYNNTHLAIWATDTDVLTRSKYANLDVTHASGLSAVLRFIVVRIEPLASGFNLKVYIDGIEVNSINSSSTLLDDDYPLYVGTRSYAGTWTSRDGTLANIRLTQSILSDSEIKRIYESEKPMFNENAACTLNGSSDAVTALAHDDITNVLSVGTSGGRSDFQGLVRVDENTNSITELAAHDGMIVEEY